MNNFEPNFNNETKVTVPQYSSDNTVLTRNFLGGILSSIALFIQTFADWRLPTEMRDIKPLIPALQSNWLLMHVSIMILSYAALLIGSVLHQLMLAMPRLTMKMKFGSMQLKS